MDWLKTTPILILILSLPTCAPNGFQADPLPPLPDGGTDDSTDSQTDPIEDSGADTDVDSDTDVDLDTDGDTETETGTDVDTDTDSETETETGTEDTETDTGLAPCSGAGVWFDETSNLCWQDPPAVGTMTWTVAVTYCDELVVAGYDDWRMPNINELRALGRPTTYECGDCGLVDPNHLMESDIDDCEACLPLLGGPGAGGCYWPAELSEIGCTSFIGFVHWSSSELWADDYHVWAWSFDGNYPGTGARNKTAIASIRCIRSL